VSGLIRFKLIVEYDGRPFVGWQRQDNGPSVQGALETAALAFSGTQTTAHAAGRTDAGVHALAMPVHVDLPERFDADTVRDALNHHMRPAPVAALSAERVDPTFHARFSCTARHYLYCIVNRRAPLALEAGRAWRIGPPLDHEAMARAAARLVGRHDFTTFRAANCQAASPVKTLTRLSVERRGERIDVAASAPSFLHHQVRSMVGTLVEVGCGRWSEADVSAALARADRAACGRVAPADGLYFVRGDYDKALYNESASDVAAD
jgi:tRNA pseudouridine38-40 synthase